MFEWWNSLGIVSQIFFCVAVPATLILIIQTVLTFIGVGGDADADGGDVGDVGDTVDAADAVDAADDILDAGNGVFESDTEVDPESVNSGMASFKLFTFRGIVAFFVIFGWVGVAMDSSKAPIWLTIPVAFVCGFAMMLSMALLLKMVMKLRSDGTADNRNAVGVSGKVQLTVPPARTGAGKVHIMLQGAYVERNAVTDEAEEIPTGSEIVVVGVSGQTDLVVRRK